MPGVETHIPTGKEIAAALLANHGVIDQPEENDNQTHEYLTTKSQGDSLKELVATVTNQPEGKVSDPSVTSTTEEVEVEATETVITDPDDIPLSCLEKFTSKLSEVSKSQNSEIIQRSASFLTLSEEDYTEKNLRIGVQLTKEFTVTMVGVRMSAVGMATLFKLKEGQLMGKVRDIHKAVHSGGWEDFAEETFPYNKSVRSLYIRLAKIRGIERYAFLGTEKLRKICTAINDDKVTGEDQVDALFKKHNESIDLSLSRRQFSIRLNALLDKVATKKKPESDDEGDMTQANPTDNNIKEDDSVGSIHSTKTVANPEVSAGSNESTSTASDPEGSTGSTESTSTSIVPKGTEASTDLTSSTTRSKGNGQTNSGGEGDEDEKKQFLNQESINIALSKFVKSVERLLEMKPPQYTLDLEMFKQARECLERLQQYAVRPSGR